MRIVVVLAVLYVVAGTGMAQAPETPSIKSVGTMSELMLDLIYPTSDEIFYVSREQKKSEKEWIDLQEQCTDAGGIGQPPDGG